MRPSHFNGFVVPHLAAFTLPDLRREAGLKKSGVLDGAELGSPFLAIQALQ